MSNIRMKELADIAGVSIASVSRALSKPDRVSKKMRERVEAAAKQVGFSPNQLGASLRTSRSNNIIAVIPDIGDTFISGVVLSLEKTAMQAGYSVLLGNTGGLRKSELSYGNMVKGRQADGVIVFSHRLPFTDEEIAHPSFSLPPLVNSCEYIDTHAHGLDPIPFIAIDNVQAGKDATEHLLSLGHKNIAVITGDLETPSAKQRLEGYKAALAAAGVAVREELIHSGEYTLEAGVNATRAILMAKTRPTAIFCMCDETALGAIATLRDQGFQVPHDMSIVGVDDIRFAKHQSPALTTVAQPVQEIGRLCAQLLVDQINGDPIPQNSHTLEHRLIIRDSTRSIK